MQLPRPTHRNAHEIRTVEIRKLRNPKVTHELCKVIPWRKSEILHFEAILETIVCSNHSKVSERCCEWHEFRSHPQQGDDPQWSLTPQPLKPNEALPTPLSAAHFVPCKCPTQHEENPKHPHTQDIQESASRAWCEQCAISKSGPRTSTQLPKLLNDAGKREPLCRPRVFLLFLCFCAGGGGGAGNKCPATTAHLPWSDLEIKSDRRLAP